MRAKSKIGLFREIHGLTQKQLASQLDIAEHTVRRWESGESKPQPRFRENLAKLLKVSPEILFEPKVRKSRTK